jgi:hypothetical protein
MEASTELRIAEYTSLREELEMNRRFVFERPLAILTAGFVGVLVLSNTAWAVLIMIPILGVLLFNLWFTANRLRSGARIIAYLQLVHEPPQEREWVGWENALRLWRLKALERKREHLPFPADIGEEMKYDVNRFYGQIFRFHLGIGVASSTLLLIRHASPELFLSTDQPVSNSVLAAGAAATIAYLAGCLTLRDADYRGGIERERRRWLEVLPRTDNAGNRGAKGQSGPVSTE